MNLLCDFVSTRSRGLRVCFMLLLISFEGHRNYTRRFLGCYGVLWWPIQNSDTAFLYNC